MKKVKNHGRSQDSRNLSARRIIDSDGHVRETDEQVMEYMPAGYRSRREAMLYFPLVPHHGWHRSIPANDFRHQDFPHEATRTDMRALVKEFFDRKDLV
jgi:hypothetical protein